MFLDEEQGPEGVIVAYEKFLSACPSDAPQVPESYYCLAILYAGIGDAEKALKLKQMADEADSEGKIISDN